MLRPLLSATAVALLASGAFAADLPLPAPAVPAAPAEVAPPPAEPAQEANFSGPYAGLEGGGGFNSTGIGTGVGTGGPACGLFCPEYDYSTDGFLGGGHIGFDMQFGHFVLGVLGDWNFSGMDGNGNGISGPNSSTGTSDYNWIGTARMRAGVAFGRVLVYATGGGIFADVEDDVVLMNAATYQGDEGDVLAGVTGGGGIEVLLGSNVSVGAEALWFDLGDRDVPLYTVPGGLPSANESDVEHSGVIVKGKVSFRFGGLGGP